MGANSTTLIDSAVLQAVDADDQIELHLTHDPAQPGRIVGSFTVLDGTPETIVFGNSGQIFGLETPGFPGDDEPFTRANFLAISPAQTVARAGIYGTLVLDTTSGEWHYSLDNNDPDVQALAQGATVFDNFQTFVFDQFRVGMENPVSHRRARQERPGHVRRRDHERRGGGRREHCYLRQHPVRRCGSHRPPCRFLVSTPVSSLGLFWLGCPRSRRSQPTAPSPGATPSTTTRRRPSRPGKASPRSSPSGCRTPLADSSTRTWSSRFTAPTRAAATRPPEIVGETTGSVIEDSVRVARGIADALDPDPGATHMERELSGLPGGRRCRRAGHWSYGLADPARCNG